MNFNPYVESFGPASFALVGVLLLVPMKGDAFAAQIQEPQQTQSQQSPPPPPPQNSQPSSHEITPPEQPASKKHKVWTNDDVVSLRSPADTYLAEKEEQEAADAKAAAQKATLAKQIKEVGITLNLPSTAEETQRLIRGKQDQINDLQDGMDRLNKDLPDALPERKPEIQKQIETFTGYLQKAHLELKVLQDHFKNLAKTPPRESPSQPPAAPPGNP